MAYRNYRARKAQRRSIIVKYGENERQRLLEMAHAARKQAAARAMLAALQSSEGMLQEILRTIADDDTADMIGELSARNLQAIAGAAAAGITTEE